MNLTKLFLFAFTVAALLNSGYANAFGRKRSTDSSAKDSQAYPARDVSFGPFIATQFTLPDGKTKVDMGLLLPELTLTVMKQTTKKLRPRDLLPPGTTPENTDRFVFKGGITSFEAEIFSQNIRFGYKPGVGDVGSGSLSDLNTTVSVTVGSLGMDFRIIDTQAGNRVVAVGKGSALTPGVKLNIDVNFGDIKTGTDFVYKSPMRKVFETAIKRAITQMVNDAQTNAQMAWSAQVLGVSGSQKKLTFNAGRFSDITAGNVFKVYDKDAMYMGLVKVGKDDDIDEEQASASYKDDSSGKLLGNTREGDTIKIQFLK